MPPSRRSWASSFGDDVVRIERLRSAQERPIARMTNYLPSAWRPSARRTSSAAASTSCSVRRGVHLHSAVQTVGARTASAAEARQLGEPRGSAVLTMQRVSFDDRGDVVEWGDHVYAASRYSFEINLLTP